MVAQSVTSSSARARNSQTSRELDLEFVAEEDVCARAELELPAAGTVLGSAFKSRSTSGSEGGAGNRMD